MDIDWHVGCLKGVSNSVQVPSHGIEEITVLTFTILE